MKTIFRWAPLFVIALQALQALQLSPARAQTILYPKPNQQVRGAVKVTFENFPEGGFAMIYLDGTDLKSFREATSQPFYLLDTRVKDPGGEQKLSEGEHSMRVVFFDAGGKRVSQSDVTFTVANSSVDESAEGVKLRVWTNRDRSNSVLRRYRITAESSAKIEGGPQPKKKKEGDAPDEILYLPTPLDYQISMLIRTDVRDVGLHDGAANIRSVVQAAYQRQRQMGPNPTGIEKVKGPWAGWGASADVGKFFVKAVRANGSDRAFDDTEKKPSYLNATRHADTLPIADLLPRFPEGTVRPGSTWESKMTLLGALPVGEQIKVGAPMTFVAFEKIQTPTGVEKRCAKLEARFNLPQKTATLIALVLQKGAGGVEHPGVPGTVPDTGDAAPPADDAAPAAGAAAAPLEKFATVSSIVTREIWFDIAGSQILRSTDAVSTYFEEFPPLVDPEAEDPPPLPLKVAYDLRITRYLDDRVPPPTHGYQSGGGPAHSKDNVRDPSHAKILGK